MLLARFALVVWLGGDAQPPTGSAVTRADVPARPRPDSLAVARKARRAQADFESYRVRNLPPGESRSGTACDEHVGRYCYWYEDESDPRMPEEPERIRDARHKLIRKLDSAAAVISGDRWVVGQRVRYLVEDGQTAEAVAVARACRAEGWWCDALTGFALHAARNFVAADSAFGVALQAMPEEERCRWTDLSLLLDGEREKRYRGLRCDERAAYEARLWWLADPLYSVPGNERRTEHFSRMVMDRLQDGARSAYGASWGSDLRELLLRFGWPVAWSRDMRSSSVTASPFQGSIAHDPSPSYEFLPSADASEDPTSSGDDDWTLATRQRVRSRYAPGYAKTFSPLVHQTAAFRRGDSVLVVARYDASDDTTFGLSAVDAALVLARDEHTPPVVAAKARAGRVDALLATAPWEPAVVSVELLAPDLRRAARARHGLRGHGGALAPAISEILLYTPSGPVPAALADAIAQMRPSTTLRRGEPIGIFWEMYGLSADRDSVTMAITVARERDGWLRRTRESLRLAARATPVRLAWRELPDARSGIGARAVTLDLATLQPGRYRIEVEVQPAGTPAHRAVREIEVTGR